MSRPIILAAALLFGFAPAATVAAQTQASQAAPTDLTIGPLLDEGAKDADAEQTTAQAVNDYDAAVAVKLSTGASVAPMIPTAVQFKKDCDKPLDRGAFQACERRKSDLAPYLPALSADEAAGAKLKALGMTTGLGETTDQIAAFKKAADAYRKSVVAEYLNAQAKMRQWYVKIRLQKFIGPVAECFHTFDVSGQSDEQITAQFKQCVEGSRPHPDGSEVQPAGSSLFSSQQDAIDRYRASGAPAGEAQARALMQHKTVPPAPAPTRPKCSIWQLLTESPASGRCFRTIRQPSVNLAVRG